MGPDCGWYFPMRHWELAEEGESEHRARGHLRLSSCDPPPKRGPEGAIQLWLLRMIGQWGGAAGGSVLLGGWARTDNSCEIGSGETEGRDDCRCLCPGLAFIRFSDE